MNFVCRGHEKMKPKRNAHDRNEEAHSGQNIFRQTDRPIARSSTEITATSMGTGHSFFSYPLEVRKMIYTAHAIESLHRQLRKIVKTAAISPMIRPLNHSLRKLRRCLYCLQIRNMTLMNSSPGSTNTSYRRSSLPKQSSMPKNN